MALPELPVDIGHAIQLAVAPVFLLTGIASLLGVMANRLARIIDRARYFDTAWAAMDESLRAAAHAEMADLERRRRLANLGIACCTVAALLICMVVAALFLEAMLELNFRWFAGLLFVTAMLSLITGLSAFLREVYIATSTVRLLTKRMEA